MKILSKRAYEAVEIGNGPNHLKVTDDQLDLIIGIMCNTVLNENKQYGNAAFQFIQTIERVFGSRLVGEVSDKMKFRVRLYDENDDTICEIDEEEDDTYFSLEVCE
jgi:hypothetical protein